MNHLDTRFQGLVYGQPNSLQLTLFWDVLGKLELCDLFPLVGLGNDGLSKRNPAVQATGSLWVGITRVVTPQPSETNRDLNAETFDCAHHLGGNL